MGPAGLRPRNPTKRRPLRRKRRRIPRRRSDERNSLRRGTTFRSRAGRSVACGRGPAAPAPASSVPQAPSPDGSDRVKASPVARRMAREAGVDLDSLSGSGPGGRIVKADVEAAAGGAASGASAETAAPSVPPSTPAPSAPAEAPAPGTAKGEIRRRGAVAHAADDRAADGRVEGDRARLHAQTDVDMEQAVVERAAIKAAAGEDDVVPSLNDLVVKACALSLQEFPRANGGYKDGRFELYERVNVGVAVAAQDALVVPTVFDADRKTLREIARGDAGARRPGPGGIGHAARALRRHVHGLEPRHVRRARVRGHHQPSAGRPAVGRRARAAAGRARRRRSSPGT